MQYAKKILGGALVVALLAPTIAGAAVFRTGDQVTTSASETIAEDLYAAGGTVTVAGPVVGDAVAAGGTMLLTGSISGDTLLGGGTVTLVGSVGDDVRAVAGALLLNARVGGDVVLAGGEVSLSGEGVGGDAVIGGGVVSINAPIQGDVLIGGGEVRIDAPINGSVKIFAEKVTVGPDARILGDFSYHATKEAVIDPGAQIVGKIQFTPIETKHREVDKGIFLALFSALVVIKFLSILLVSLLLGLWFKRYTTMIVEKSVSSPLLEFGRGAVIAIVTPILSIIFLSTIIGIPLGIFGLIGFAAIVLLSSTALAPIIMGSFLYKHLFKTPTYDVSWKSILLGVFVYLVLGLIPLIGWLIVCVTVLMGVGAAMKIKWDIAKSLQ